MYLPAISMYKMARPISGSPRYISGHSSDSCMHTDHRLLKTHRWKLINIWHQKQKVGPSGRAV